VLLFKMLFQHLAVALLAIGVSASDVTVLKREVPSTHVVHERQMEHWALSWVKKRKVRDSALLPMRIGLKQSNLDHGRDLLMEM
jgi:tripeptidyl-peptidase-1